MKGTRRMAAVIVAAALVALILAGCKGDGGGHHHGHGKRAYAARVFHDGRRQQRCLGWLWRRESHWNARAVNPDSGAYGIPQALPSAQGHPFALGAWKAQIRWGHRYIVRRYGSPCSAWSHETQAGWY